MYVLIFYLHLKACQDAIMLMLYQKQHDEREVYANLLNFFEHRIFTCCRGNLYFLFYFSNFRLVRMRLVIPYLR